MINDTKNDKSYVVVAYVVLFIFIGIGVSMGWIAHLAYTNSSPKTCVCEKK